MSAPRFPTTATADGALKDFSLGFPIISDQHVRVFDNGVLKVRGTDYAIQDPTANAASGYPTVHFFTAPTNAHTLKFHRNTPLTPDSPTIEIGPRTALFAQYRAEEEADRRVTLRDSFGQTALLAPTALSFVAPFDCYIEKLKGKVLKAVTTGGAITVEVDTVAVTGLAITVADADAAGTTYSDTPTTAQSSTTKAYKGQAITVTPAAAFATAGDVEVEVELQRADF